MLVNMTWTNPPKNFKRAVKKDIQNHTKRVALKLLRSLVTESPIDLGRFNLNWLVGLNRKDSRIINRTDLGKTIAISTGGAIIKKHKSFGSIWISNNLPYARKLNQGHSSQAPANFVEKATARAVKR